MATRRSALALAGMLAAMGVLHGVRPGPFDAIVPRALPGPARFWTYASGVAELGCAALLASPRTRRLGGYATAGLFAAVFPANVQMAWDLRHGPARARAVAYGRLPLQVPLVLWALRAARTAPR